MKLYAHMKHYKTYKALIAAQYAELAIDMHPDADSQPQTGRIPVLETSEGCIFTSMAIARYIARIRRDVGLYGQSLIESGMIDSWIEFCTHELEIPLCSITLPAMGVVPADSGACAAQAKEDANRALNVLNKHLLHNTFMVGDRVSLADICIACALYDAMTLNVLDEKIRAPLGNLMRWYSLVSSQPEFIAVLGEIKLGGGKSAPSSQNKKEAEKKPPAAAAKNEAKNKAPKEQEANTKKAESKKESKKNTDKTPAKAEEKKEQSPEDAKKEKEKKIKKVIKEGGKRGVEIDGAADMGGLQFFCTSCEEPEGDLELLGMCLDAMNAESDPTEEERKGGSGRIGKMIFSAGTEQLAVISYVPEALRKEITTGEWLEKVLGLFGGEVVSVTPSTARGVVKADGDKGKFPLKMKEPCITEAISYLKSKGLFPDKESDSDEIVFGDDDFPS